MSPSRLVLGLLCVVGVAFAGTYVDHSVGPGSDGPHAVEWEFETDEGELRLAHRGGDGVPRESLSLTIARDGTGDERILDLASSDHQWVERPFEDATVTRGETLVLAAPNDEHATIYLHWEDPSGNSTLASVEHPSGEG